MDSDSLLVDGRCRLFGIRYTIVNNATTTANTVYSPAGTLANRVFTLKDGSSGGSVLFQCEIVLGVNPQYGVGTQPFPFMFGNGSILFRDGIYVPKWPTLLTYNDPDPGKTELVVFYEG